MDKEEKEPFLKILIPFLISISIFILILVYYNVSENFDKKKNKTLVTELTKTPKESKIDNKAKKESKKKTVQIENQKNNKKYKKNSYENEVQTEYHNGTLGEIEKAVDINFDRKIDGKDWNVLSDKQKQLIISAYYLSIWQTLKGITPPKEAVEEQISQAMGQLNSFYDNSNENKEVLDSIYELNR